MAEEPEVKSPEKLTQTDVLELAGRSKELAETIAALEAMRKQLNDQIGAYCAIHAESKIEDDNLSIALVHATRSTLSKPILLKTVPADVIEKATITTEYTYIKITAKKNGDPTT